MGLRTGSYYYWGYVVLIATLVLMATSTTAMSVKQGNRSKSSVARVSETVDQKKPSSSKEVFKFMDKIDWNDEDQIRHILEVANYVIYGLPIAWSLQYIIIYAYSYFVIYTTKWVLQELNRGGDINHPVNYQKLDQINPMQTAGFDQFLKGFMSVTKNQQDNFLMENKNVIGPAYTTQNYYEVVRTTAVPYFLNQLHGPEHGSGESNYRLYGRSLLKPPT